MSYTANGKMHFFQTTLHDGTTVWQCQCCPLGGCFFHTPEGALEHLKAHVRAGHVLPVLAFCDIIIEAHAMGHVLGEMSAISSVVVAGWEYLDMAHDAHGMVSEVCEPNPAWQAVEDAAQAKAEAEAGPEEYILTVSTCEVCGATIVFEDLFLDDPEYDSSLPQQECDACLKAWAAFETDYPEIWMNAEFIERYERAACGDVSLPQAYTVAEQMRSEGLIH
jgi:hypothetical protein